MIRNITRGISLIIVLSVFSFADNNASIIEKINQKCTQTRTIEAHFEQIYTNLLTKEKLTEKGILYFLAPHFIKIEYSQPQKKFFLADGLYYYFYDPDENQVIKSDTSTDKSLWLSIINGCNIQSHFKILKMNEQTSCYFLALEPLKEKEEITKLELEISKNTFTLSKITMYEDIGNTNAYTFSDIKINPALDENLFMFSSPKDAEIIYMKE